MANSLKSHKASQSFWTNFVLIVICVLWMIPILGILITSFRPSDEIFRNGWWNVFPHKEDVEVSRVVIPESVDVDGPISYGGKTATFQEWQRGIQLDDGTKATWYGNKRTRTLIISENKWVGFATNLTLENYKDVLTGKTITYKNAQGQTITRTGNNLGGAFLNSLAVTIPGTIIPILIAAFAAFGFAWLDFPGRNVVFTIIVALLVVPLQIALVPILQDYVKLELNGTFLGIWLAHTGFGLPLATYLLFNYISTIPRELLESAYIDGASNFTIFTNLILPLSVPALASFAIFQFLWLWNDYLVALVFLGEKNQTVTIAVAQLVGEKGQDWHLMTAAAFISMILPLVVFLSLQRYFVRGLMAGSVKG
ncbi:MAG TPA: carbohydrate ABC transporter permease [Anaerolineaceae bacterium]|nr:carbohydrate ABC transporter permease [Anaerolineaceae bacterium]